MNLRERKRRLLTKPPLRISLGERKDETTYAQEPCLFALALYSERDASSKVSPRSTALSIAVSPQRINTEDRALNDGPGRAKNGDLDFIGVYSFYGVHA